MSLFLIVRLQNAGAIAQLPWALSHRAPLIYTLEKFMSVFRFIKGATAERVRPIRRSFLFDRSLFLSLIKHEERRKRQGNVLNICNVVNSVGKHE